MFTTGFGREAAVQPQGIPANNPLPCFTFAAVEVCA
jgi:hypothetical protein